MAFVFRGRNACSYLVFVKTQFWTRQGAPSGRSALVQVRFAKDKLISTKIPILTVAPGGFSVVVFTVFTTD